MVNVLVVEERLLRRYGLAHHLVPLPLLLLLLLLLMLMLLLLTSIRLLIGLLLLLHPRRQRLVRRPRRSGAQSERSERAFDIVQIDAVEVPSDSVQ